MTLLNEDSLMTAKNWPKFPVQNKSIKLNPFNAWIQNGLLENIACIPLKISILRNSIRLQPI